MAWKPRAYTIKPNWKIGTNTEKRFCELMNELGIGCKKTSEHVDKNYHVDFILGDQTPVDLKGNKNTYAIWLEKRNVWGGKGSLFGFAKYIVIDLVDIKTFVFSSTASVYADNDLNKCMETSLTQPRNAYGSSKLLSLIHI